MIEEQGYERYEKVMAVASGGMASVWAARLRGRGLVSSSFHKVVAMKSMLPDLARETEYRAMFLDEARVTAKLHHPNLCETFDAGEEQGELYIAMEWIDGVSVYRLLKPTGGIAEPLPLRIAMRIVTDACAGLHAAHEAVDDDGSPLMIIHRDVSPQNLLVSADGHVKVTDFGIAEAKGKRHETAAGQAKGKLAYMAPEQLRADALDRRVDVFALGCVLYEATTGQKPFTGDTDGEIARRILNETPRPPSELVAGYPAELERILSRAMAKDPSERFASAEGLRLALELSGLGGTASLREVAAIVRDRCGSEIAARRDKLQRALSAPPPSRVGSTPTRTRARRLLPIAVAAVAMIGALGWMAALPSPPPPHVIALATTAETRPELPVSLPPAPEPAPASEETETATTVDVVVRPAAAQLTIDGSPVELDDAGRARIPRPAAGEFRVGIAKAEGQVDRLFVVDDASETVEVSLEPVSPRS